MIQHLRPDLVCEDCVKRTHLDGPYDLMSMDLMECGALGMYADKECYADSGAIGDPELATPENGERFYEGYCTAIADLYREIHQSNR